MGKKIYWVSPAGTYEVKVLWTRLGMGGRETPKKRGLRGLIPLYYLETSGNIVLSLALTVFLEPSPQFPDMFHALTTSGDRYRSYASFAKEMRGRFLRNTMYVLRYVRDIIQVPPCIIQYFFLHVIDVFFKRFLLRQSLVPCTFLSLFLHNFMHYLHGPIGCLL